MHPEQWNFVCKKVGIVLTVDQMTVERLCFRSGQLKCFIAKKWTNWCGKKVDSGTIVLQERTVERRKTESEATSGAASAAAPASHDEGERY